MIEFKKFLLFIVEGKNDEREINAIIHAFCKETIAQKKYDVRFVPPKGDITSDNATNEKNIISRVEKRILDFRNGGIPFQRIKASDIAAVIHIVDTDGTFIPHENVIEEDVGDFTYHDTTMGCSPRDKGVQRNSRKSKALNKLICQNQIGGIPYSIYFASCNMDHLLYGERNPPQSMKNSFSFSFSDKCSKPGIKYSEILPDEFVVEGDYGETWSFIKQGTNSLSRLTNLDLLFRNVIGLSNEETE